MSYINLKSRSSTEPTALNISPLPPSRLYLIDSQLVSNRTYSPPRQSPTIPGDGYLAARAAAPPPLTVTTVTPAAAMTTPLHGIPTTTTTTTTSHYPLLSSNTSIYALGGTDLRPAASAAPTATPSGSQLPAASLLKVELDHTKSMLDRQTELAQRSEREKRLLADQIEVLRREHRETKESGNTEWRRRLSDAADESNKLRSDLALASEESASLRAALAEARRAERRAEGLGSKVQDLEDALLRQEVATSELRKAKQVAEKELNDLHRSNPSAVFKSKIQQLEIDLASGEDELRRKQEEIVTIARQLQASEEGADLAIHRLREEERKSAQLLTELNDASRRMVELERKAKDREEVLRKAAGDAESAVKAAQRRAEDAVNGSHIAEQTLATVQMENKRRQQGAELHSVQRAAEIESLNKQLDIFKGKIQDLTRDLQDTETRASNDRRIRDGIESELSRERIVCQDLKLTSDRTQQEFGRLEKENATLFAQINNLNITLSAITDEKIRFEKMLETANVKIEIGTRVSADLDATEKTLNEKRAFIADLESKLRSIEPYVPRVEALTTMNDALRAEVGANRQEITALRIALEEERDSHSRTSNKIRILEAKLSQSDDRHEELFSKLKTLELVQNGDRGNQLAGTFSALHERISSTDADTIKVLEVNATLLKDVKQMEAAMKDMEKQVSRAREITREAEMGKVQAEVARDEVLGKLASKDRELLACSEQYASYAPMRINSERRSYTETIESLQSHLAFEKEQAAKLKQDVSDHQSMQSALAAQRDLNVQQQAEIARLRGSGNTNSPSQVPAIDKNDIESIQRSHSASNLLTTAEIGHGAKPVAESRTVSPYRAPVARTQEPSPIQARAFSPASATTAAGSPLPSRVADDDVLRGMQLEMAELRLRAHQEQAGRDTRMEFLSSTLAEAINEMKGLREARSPKGNTPTASTLGKVGSGAVTAAHRSLLGPNTGVSPLRQRQRNEAEGLRDSPHTSPYREVGSGGAVVAVTPQGRVVSPNTRGSHAAPRTASNRRIHTTNISVHESGSLSPSVVTRGGYERQQTTFNAPTAASRAKAQPGSVSPSTPTLRRPATSPTSRRDSTKVTVRGSDGGDYYSPQHSAAPSAPQRRSSFRNTKEHNFSVEYERNTGVAIGHQDPVEEVHHPDPSTLDDEELLKELEAAKKRMKRVLMKDRMAASPGNNSGAVNVSDRVRY